MRPLNRHYFVLQTNPGEQFYLFTSLAAWLIRKTGRMFEPPQEYDDPNSTIANILDNVRQIGVAIDFPPSKLKQVGSYIPLLRYFQISIWFKTKWDKCVREIQKTCTCAFTLTFSIILYNLRTSRLAEQT